VSVRPLAEAPAPAAGASAWRRARVRGGHLVEQPSPGEASPDRPNPRAEAAASASAGPWPSLDGAPVGQPVEPPDARGAVDEGVLVARARGGDLDAYELLVTRHEEIAYRVAYLVLRDAAAAEDATQEAFFKAYAALGRFRVGEPFRPWLLRIVTNQALSARRADRRRDEMQRRLQGTVAPAHESSPESVALGRERRATVLAALGELRPDEQLILQLRYFLELGEAEVAAALGCPRGTVKSRLHRAQARLRQLLVPLFPELAPTVGPVQDA
jgi:RNA polymerase sigma factor (sigma-70 family)